MQHPLLAVLIALSLSTPALAGLPGAGKLTPDLALRLHQAQLERGALPARLPVVVRFAVAPSAAALRDLEERGVTFRRREDGSIAHVGTLYGAAVDVPAGLDALERHPAVREIAPNAPRGTRPWPAQTPYSKVPELTTTWVTQPRRDVQDRRVTGQGVVICDIDDGIEIYHPLFWRADGGVVAWIDADGNGRLDPGVDGVDRDGDGEADVTLELLDVGLGDYKGGAPTGLDGQYTPARDYLYADLDGSGVREMGPNAGFTEADPTFGEPLFIGDDVDGNGVIEFPERLIALGTSKVKGVYRLGSGNTYVRGENLHHHVFTDGPHGTGVGGILVGGHPGHGDIVGVAPDADLVVINRYGLDQESGESDLATAVDWAKGLGADVILHEYGSHFGEYADGSSTWEALVDTLSEGGAPQLTATHNFAGQGGQGEGAVMPGQSKAIPFEVYDLGDWGYGYYLLATLRWRDTDTVVASLETPDGQMLDLDLGTGVFGTWYVGVEGGTSPRGTGMIAFFVVSLDAQGQPQLLPDGVWTLHVFNPGDETANFHLSLSDESGYAYGLDILEGGTDEGSIAHPSTADTAISVGASVGNIALDGEVEEGIKIFSGRGPRIDGALGIDVVAPEDHFTSVAAQTIGGPHFGRFGGTSGALPQVAGAVALLEQVEPDLTAEQVRQRVHDSSIGDLVTGAVPSNTWGYGRLRTHRLVFGTESPANTGPQAMATAPAAWAGAETVFDASASTDGQDLLEGLRFSWDVDYDGVWDSVAVGDPELAHTFDEPGEHVVKLAVEDSLGWTSELLLVVEVSDEAPPAPDPDPQADAAPEVGPEAVEVGPEAVEGGGDDVGTDAVVDSTSTPGARDEGCAGGGGGGAPTGLALAVALALAWLGRRRRS